MNVNYRLGCFALISLMMGVSPSFIWAARIALSPQADTHLRDETISGLLPFMDVRGAAADFRGYVRFDLSAIPAGAKIVYSTIELFQVAGASRNDVIINSRFSLYGLNNAPGNTAQNWDEATFVIGDKGTEDVTTLTGVTDLDGDVAGITETIGGGAPVGLVNVHGVPLANFLQSRFVDGGLATLILSNDDALDRGYGIGTRENSDTTRIPILHVDYAVPEPGSLALFVLALISLGFIRRG